MKRVLLLAVITVMGIGGLQAQSITGVKAFQRLLSKQINDGLITKEGSYKAAQPRTADSSRLTGISYFSYKLNKYSISDSEQFAYTGSNGGGYIQFLQGNLKFTTENCLVFDAGDFSDDTLITQKFNANDNIDSIFTQVWDNIGSKWVNNQLSTEAYDANGNTILEQDFITDKGAWRIDDKVEFAYTNSNLDTTTGLLYDTTTSKFVPFIKIINDYTSFNAIDTEIALLSNGSVLEDYEINTYYYDSHNNDTAELVQLYSAGWQNYERVTVSYVAGTKYPQLEYIFEPSGNKWDSTYKQLYYYDANYNDTAIVLQTFNLGEWLGDEEYAYQYNGFNQPTVLTILNFNGSSYASASREVYYYQLYTAGIAQIPGGAPVTMYPNPTTGLITVNSSKNMDEVTVTNLLGQVVYQSQPKQTHFNFELKEEGMYFVTVKEGDDIATNKVTVSK